MMFKRKIEACGEKAYIIHPKNISIKENEIICIPTYMTFCLK